MLTPRCLHLLAWLADPDAAKVYAPPPDPEGDFNDECLFLRREGLISVGADTPLTLKGFAPLTRKGLIALAGQLPLDPPRYEQIITLPSEAAPRKNILGSGARRAKR